jgi:ribosomal-protein-alanine N-acetyltransferase
MIKKKKILLLKFKISDITEDYVSWIRSKSITKFTKIKKSKIEDIIQYVLKNISDKNVFFLKVLFNNIHIGNVRIQKMKIKKEASVAIIIGNKRFHNKGIGTAVIAKVIKIMKKNKNIKTLVAYIYKMNYPSISIFKKNGFSKDEKNQSTNQRWSLSV